MINNPGKVFEREEIGKLIDLDKVYLVLDEKI